MARSRTKEEEARDEAHRQRFKSEWRAKQEKLFPVADQPPDGTVLSNGREVVEVIDKESKQKHHLVLPPGRYHKATLMATLKKAYREADFPLGKAWSKACAEARVPNYAPALAFDCFAPGSSDQDAPHSLATTPSLIVITPEGFQRECNATPRTVPWAFHGMPMRQSTSDPLKLEPIPLEEVQVEWWYQKGMQDALQINHVPTTMWTCDFFSDESALTQEQWNRAVASLRAQLKLVPYVKCLAAVPRMLRYYSDGSIASQTGEGVRPAWHIQQGNIAPLIYDGPALALRLALKDYVLPGRVYVDYNGKFICSDWCQREVGKHGGIDLIHGGTTKHTLQTWVAGPATSRFGGDAGLGRTLQVQRLKPLPNKLLKGTFNTANLTVMELAHRFPQRIVDHPKSMCVVDWVQQVVDNPRVHGREVFLCAGPRLEFLSDLVPQEMIQVHNKFNASYPLPLDANGFSFAHAVTSTPSWCDLHQTASWLANDYHAQVLYMIVPYRERDTGARRFSVAQTLYVVPKGGGGAVHVAARRSWGATAQDLPLLPLTGRILLRRGERTQLSSGPLTVDVESYLRGSFRDITNTARNSAWVFGHEPVHIRPSRYLKKVGGAACSPS